jgi:hypothetical protein
MTSRHSDRNWRGALRHRDPNNPGNGIAFTTHALEETTTAAVS